MNNKGYGVLEILLAITFFCVLVMAVWGVIR